MKPQSILPQPSSASTDNSVTRRAASLCGEPGQPGFLVWIFVTEAKSTTTPKPTMKRILFMLMTLLALALLPARATLLSDLTKPQEGRSMRNTSTMRVGEVRRGGGERKIDPKAEPRGDLSEESNFDNFTVEPGATHVLMDEKGPGVITHMWLTFLGPEPQDWAPKGAANHQEMLLRIYWDGEERPSVEAPRRCDRPSPPVA